MMALFLYQKSPFEEHDDDFLIFQIVCAPTFNEFLIFISDLHLLKRKSMIHSNSSLKRLQGGFLTKNQPEII